MSGDCSTCLSTACTRNKGQKVEEEQKERGRRWWIEACVVLQRGWWPARRSWLLGFRKKKKWCAFSPNNSTNDCCCARWQQVDYCFDTGEQLHGVARFTFFFFFLFVDFLLPPFSELIFKAQTIPESYRAAGKAFIHQLCHPAHVAI